MYHKYAYKNQGGKGGEENKEDGKKEEEAKDAAQKSTTRQKIMKRILMEAQTLPERVMTPESEKYAKIGKCAPKIIFNPSPVTNLPP